MGMRVWVLVGTSTGRPRDTRGLPVQFPSGGFIAEEDDEANSEVKLRRKNIANEMWNSYLNYMADAEAGNSDEDYSSSY